LLMSTSGLPLTRHIQEPETSKSVTANDSQATKMNNQ
jgi:hypothetical protein